jgi:hypothetical protein
MFSKLRSAKAIGVAATLSAALFATGAAAATGSLPDAAQDGLSKASSHVGIDLPASKDNHPTKADHPGGAASEIESAKVDEGTGPVDNHGAEVSDVARNTDATGREHGQAVSEAARQDHGPAVNTPNGGGTDTADDASNGASEHGTDKAAPQAANGSDNSEGHGRP